jgi:hypothetical protein
LRRIARAAPMVVISVDMYTNYIGFSPQNFKRPDADSGLFRWGTLAADTDCRRHLNRTDCEGLKRHESDKTMDC